jgi:small subunit ribosomal protein S16
MTKIKLQRLGKKHQPEYRIIVMPEREKMTAIPIEILGTYNPAGKKLNFDAKRLEYWLKVGAQPTATVRSLLKI